MVAYAGSIEIVMILTATAAALVAIFSAIAAARSTRAAKRTAENSALVDKVGFIDSLAAQLRSEQGALTLRRNA
jgi:hypothetical protein